MAGNDSYTKLLIHSDDTDVITVTDGCSTVTERILSTSGNWVEIYLSQGGIYGDTHGVGPYTGPHIAPFVGSGGDAHVGRYEQVGTSKGIKVLQWFEGGDGNGGVRTWAAGMAWCAAAKSAPIRDVRYLSGELFIWPELCGNCGDCTFGLSETWFNRHLGFHATMQPNGYGYYNLHFIWQYVVRTQIWEWRC